MKQKDTTYVIVDLETTGLSVTDNGITEIGAIKFNKDFEILDQFETFVNPGHLIPEFITKLTGITDEDVKDAPSEENAVAAFLDWAGDDVQFFAFNSGFDFGFIGHISGCWPEHSDILQMARKAFPGLRSHKLQTLAKVLKINPGNAHRAVDDCKTSMAVLQYCFAHPNGEEKYRQPREKRGPSYQDICARAARPRPIWDAIRWTFYFLALLWLAGYLIQK